MQIIKYEFTKKGKYNIYLSNGEVISLGERTITKNELLLKKDISDELYDNLLIDDKIYDAIDICIKYINIRIRSIKEIKDYLKKKEYSNDIIDEVIKYLIDNKYLDDDKFTKAYIKDKLNFTNKGDYKIKMELQNLGVDSSIIDLNMDSIDNDLLDNKIRKNIDKDIRNNKKYSNNELKNKIYNHLVTSGYSKDRVISILNEYDF